MKHILIVAALLCAVGQTQAADGTPAPSNVGNAE